MVTTSYSCVLYFDSSNAETVVMCCEFNPNASLVAAGLSNGSLTVSQVVSLVTIVTDVQVKVTFRPDFPLSEPARCTLWALSLMAAVQMSSCKTHKI